MKKIKPISYREKNSCLGKVKHKTMLSAQTDLNSLLKIAKKEHSLTIYKCDFCKYLHIGNG